MDRAADLKQRILALTREYAREVHGTKPEFVAGKSFVKYGGRYFDEEEVANLVDASLDFWLTPGRGRTVSKGVSPNGLGWSIVRWSIRVLRPTCWRLWR